MRKRKKGAEETETKISLMKTQIYFNIILRFGLLEDEAEDTTSLRNFENYIFVEDHSRASQNTSSVVISSRLGHG